MHPTLPSSSLAMRMLRRAAVGALLLSAAGALPAAAQSISVAYLPGNGPGTGFGQARFTISAGSSALFVDALTLNAQPGAATFAHVGGVGDFVGEDQFEGGGVFGGATSVTPGGGSLLIDFLAQLGGAFTLDANGSGYVIVELDEDAGPLAYTFAADTDAGPITGIVGTVSTVPEPGTVVLLATGLGLVGLVARRRRA